MPHIPLNLVGASFGIAGLPGTWRPQPSADIPAWIGDALLVVAAVSWLLTLAGYAVWAIGDRRGARTDLTDPVAAPFAALAVITPVLLAAEGIAPHAPVVGAVVTAVLCERPAATTEGTGQVSWRRHVAANSDARPVVVRGRRGAPTPIVVRGGPFGAAGEVPLTHCSCAEGRCSWA